MLDVIREDLALGNWTAPHARYRWITKCDLVARVADALRQRCINRTYLRVVGSAGGGGRDSEHKFDLEYRTADGFSDAIEAKFPVGRHREDGVQMSAYANAVAADLTWLCDRKGKGFSSKHFMLILPQMFFERREMEHPHALRASTLMSPTIGPMYAAYAGAGLDAPGSTVHLKMPGGSALERRKVGTSNDYLWALIFTNKTLSETPPEKRLPYEPPPRRPKGPQPWDWEAERRWHWPKK